MSKKCVIASVMVALVMGLSGSAWADPFTQTLYPNVHIEEGETYEYDHDLALATPPLTIPPDQVNFATLKLTFKDDDLLQKEFVFVALDNGDQTWGWKEVDSGTYPITVNPALLNDDGVLNVAVTVDDDPLEWWADCLNWADVKLCKSEICGDYTSPVPLPGAVLLGVIGLVAAGRKLRKVC